LFFFTFFLKGMFIQPQRNESQVLFQQNQQLPERELEVSVKNEAAGGIVSRSPVTENEKILSLEKAILLSQNESLRAQVELVKTRFERELRTMREQVLGTKELREENGKLRQRVLFLEAAIRRAGLHEADLQPVRTCAPVVCPMMPNSHHVPGRPKLEHMPALEVSPEPILPRRVQHTSPRPNALPFNSRPQVSAKRRRENDDDYTPTVVLNRKRVKQRKSNSKSVNPNKQPSIKAQVLDVLRGLKTGGTHVDVKSATTLLTKKQVQRALSELNCCREAEVVGKRANEGYIYKATQPATCHYINGAKPSMLVPQVSSGSDLDMRPESAVHANKLSPTTSLTSAPKLLKLRPPSLHKAVKSKKAITQSSSKMSPTILAMSTEKSNPSVDIVSSS